MTILVSIVIDQVLQNNFIHPVKPITQTAHTVSSAMKWEDLMATTIAGHSSLKLSFWTSIIGTTSEDVMLIFASVCGEKT